MARNRAPSPALSPEALSALMTTGTNRQGAKVQIAAHEHEVRAELLSAGVIGQDDGLTRSGSVARQRHFDRLLDDLLG